MDGLIKDVNEDRLSRSNFALCKTDDELDLYPGRCTWRHSRFGNATCISDIDQVDEKKTPQTKSLFYLLKVILVFFGGGRGMIEMSKCPDTDHSK